MIFIGSGHACWHGAVLLTLAKKKVALVERDVLGGTCTNYGCDAKILLGRIQRSVGKALAYEKLDRQIYEKYADADTSQVTE